MQHEQSPDELDFTKVDKAPDTTAKTPLDKEIDACRKSMSQAYAQMMDARIAKKDDEKVFAKIYRDEGVRFQELLDKKRKIEAGIKEADAVADRLEKDSR